MLGRVRSGAQCMWTGLLIFIHDIPMHMQRNTHSSNQTEAEISRYKDRVTHVYSDFRDIVPKVCVKMNMYEV